jgi:predicted nucleotidyltransferase
MFGSLAWGRVHDESDLDLAVEGLAPERTFAALSRVSSVAGEQVDLVPLESCAESLRRRILEHGIRVDER